LIKPGLEVAVRRFHVPVFMRLSHVDPMPFHAIVIEQGLVLLGELLVAGKIVDRRSEAVAPHPLWHAASQMQGVLKSRRQGFKRLGMAEMNGLPIGIREDRVKQHVIIRSAANRDPQAIQDDEVKRDHVPRMMNLRKRDFLLDSVVEFPFLHPPLQRPPNRIRDRPLTRFGVVVFLLEPIQQSKGLQTRILLQKGLDLGPISFERIGPRAIRSRRTLLLAGEFPLVAVISNGSFSHAQCSGNLSHRNILMKQRKHPSGFGILEHRKPPCAKGLR
jgi:hypothetical protein